MAIGGADIQVSAGDLVVRVPAIISPPTITVPAPDPQKIFPLVADGPSVVLNRVIVVGTPGHDSANIDDLASRNDARILVRFEALEAYLFEIEAESPEELLAVIEALAQDSSVTMALPDLVLAPAGRDSIDTALLDDYAKVAYTGVNMEFA